MFGEGLELQRVERVLSASDVLHGVFPSAALTEETEEEEEEEETENTRFSFWRRHERTAAASLQPHVDGKFSMQTHATIESPPFNSSTSLHQFHFLWGLQSKTRFGDLI